MTNMNNVGIFEKKEGKSIPMIPIEPDYSDEVLPVVKDRLDEAGIKNIQVAEFKENSVVRKYMVIPGANFDEVRRVIRRMHNQLASKKDASRANAVHQEQEVIVSNAADAFIEAGAALTLPLSPENKNAVRELLRTMAGQGIITINAPKP
jgi:hypothetical protein